MPVTAVATADLTKANPLIGAQYAGVRGRGHRQRRDASLLKEGSPIHYYIFARATHRDSGQAKAGIERPQSVTENGAEHRIEKLPCDDQADDGQHAAPRHVDVAQ